MLSGTGRHRERPATFREVLSTREYRAVYGAATLSWIGDATARAAVTALVFQVTDSAAASAGAFAITYAPWLLGSSVLVALAERYPHRTVMVICDTARVVIMATVAIIPMPVPVVLILVLGAAFFAPPFDAARSASLPAILGGDRYVLGLALFSATNQPAQVAGYLVGAALSVAHPRLAFAVNAVTFAVSALLIRFGVQWREPGLAPARRTRLLRETTDGFKVVFGNPALRVIALLVFGGVLFMVIPEGLGAAWAAQLTDGPDRGWVQGMIMAAVPFGAILGSLSISRLVAPTVRVQLMRPLAVLVPLALVPALFSPPIALVVLLAAACGFAMGAVGPVANGQFVQRLPTEFRARAFGVVQAGVQLLQGAAVLITGALAERFPVPVVVGGWGLVGLALMLAVVFNWPEPEPVAEPSSAAPVAVPDPAVDTPPARHAAPAPDPSPAPRPRPAGGPGLGGGLPGLANGPHRDSGGGPGVGSGPGRGAGTGLDGPSGGGRGPGGPVTPMANWISQPGGQPPDWATPPEARQSRPADWTTPPASAPAWGIPPGAQQPPAVRPPMSVLGNDGPPSEQPHRGRLANAMQSVWAATAARRRASTEPPGTMEP